MSFGRRTESRLVSSTDLSFFFLFFTVLMKLAECWIASFCASCLDVFQTNIKNWLLLKLPVPSPIFPRGQVQSVSCYFFLAGLKGGVSILAAAPAEQRLHFRINWFEGTGFTDKSHLSQTVHIGVA